MSLNEVETRSLAQIAEALESSDRQLARDLRHGRPRRSTADRITIALAVVLVATLIVGVALQLRIVCAAAWTAVILLTVVRGIYGDGY